MPRGGRYRAVRVALWSREDFQTLAPPTRLTLLALSTGSFSNIAGIGLLSLEALRRETGLGATDLEAALGELEKRPTPGRSFIMRDEYAVLWVRNLLRDDPSREKDPNVRNPNHRTAVETILGALPRTSPTVKKFKNYYGFTTHRVSGTPFDTPSDTPSHTPSQSRIRRRRTETENGEGERESERGDGSPLVPPSVAGALDSDNGNDPATKHDYLDVVARIGQKWPLTS
jgi:hypothetical protein